MDRETLRASLQILTFVLGEQPPTQPVPVTVRERRRSAL